MDINLEQEAKNFWEWFQISGGISFYLLYKLATGSLDGKSPAGDD